MDINELKDKLRVCGVVGAGGAGFPSYAKLNESADTVILNCAECEPLLTLHRQVLEKYVREILSAMTVVCETVGAERGIVAIKPSYKAAVTAVESALSEFNKISIGLLPEVYPAGDEIVAIYETTGRVVLPGQLPISVGVTVFNVETMLNIYRAITNGAGVTHKYITVTGEVKSPVTLKVPLGVTNNEVIKLAGGTTVEDYVILCGGPMMGRLVSGSDIITKTSNALIVLPSDHYVIQKHKANPRISLKRAMSACCQCNMCTSLCPRNLLGHPIEPNKFMRSLSSGVTSDVSPYLGTFSCVGCGVCEMYACFQNLSPRMLINAVKGNLKSKGIAPPKVDAKPVKEERNGRYVLKSRLTARLDLNKYDVPATLDEEKVYAPESVRILLSQHIGKPAVAAVNKGDKVNAGDTVANASKDALSVSIHTPISGTVLEVTEKYVVISAD